VPYIYQGKKYRSKKHPILEFIFEKYNPSRNSNIKNIDFTLKDISDGYTFCNIPEPASISNTILDLTRKKADISTRLPESIYSLGYDLKKKTGSDTNNGSFAGTFVFVGIGKQIDSWLTWPKETSNISISSLNIPSGVKKYLRNDEGALFSVIDYCDVFSTVLYADEHKVVRIQNPMKWQPNEIDGCYYSSINEVDTIFSVEAKALTTGDDINLIQLEGGVQTILNKINDKNVLIVPLAIQMVKNGIKIAKFKTACYSDLNYELILEETFLIEFNPPIKSWS
jgi:hypothetical protein